MKARRVPSASMLAMARFSVSSLFASAGLAGVLLLTACSPKYDWREVRGSDAPFVVMLPSKPASHTRGVNLDGIQVNMTMTAADVDGVAFAIGVAQLPDAMLTDKALDTMKRALVRNIGGTVTHEKSLTVKGMPMLSLQASGPPAAGSEHPRLLLARFIAQDRYVYQLVVVGKENALAHDAADIFFSSFQVR